MGLAYIHPDVIDTALDYIKTNCSHFRVEAISLLGDMPPSAVYDGLTDDAVALSLTSATKADVDTGVGRKLTLDSFTYTAIAQSGWDYSSFTNYTVVLMSANSTNVSDVLYIQELDPGIRKAMDIGRTDVTMTPRLYQKLFEISITVS